jgi:ADP-heptose:LPS heptosyltransferase
MPGTFVVLQSSVMGDLVCTTPVFRAIKKAHPENKVYVVGVGWVKDILKNSPDVDGFISLDENRSSIIRQIRELNPLFGCLATPNFKGLALLYMSGIRSISAPWVKNGFSPAQTRLYRFLLKFVIPVAYSFGVYAPREYLKLLEPAGIHTQDTTKHLAYSEKAKQGVDQFLIAEEVRNEDLLIGISPSCGNKIKNWGGDRFAVLATYLMKTYGAKIVIISGPKDRDEYSDMMSALPDKAAIIDAAEKFDIDELKALMASLKLFVAVDTGPIYIAEAFNVPTVDIIGPVDEREQPPVGPLHRVVYLKDRKESMLHIFNARIYDAREARRQSQEISIPMVISEVDSILAQLGIQKI